MNNFFSKLNEDLICKYYYGGLTASTQTPFHCHDGYEILIFLGGTASFYVEHHCATLTRGDIICCSPYTFHRAVPQNKQTYERVLINFSTDKLKEVNSPLTNLSECFYNSPHSFSILHLSDEELDSMVSYTKRLEKCLWNPCWGNDVLRNALLTEILVTLNQYTSHQTPATSIMAYSSIVANIFSYIDTHYREEFRLKNLAEELHHNADYLSRCFKKEIGCTIQQFVITKRISYAQKLLRKGVFPLETCFLSGFENYSNFSRTFTKHTGISPKRYQLHTESTDTP